MGFPGFLDQTLSRRRSEDTGHRGKVRSGGLDLLVGGEGMESGAPAERGFWGMAGQPVGLPAWAAALAESKDNLRPAWLCER